MSNQKIQRLLDKFSDFDKDERFMAINDMQQLLRRKDMKIDAATERRICQALLQRLEKDNSNDVQTIAVACISDVVQMCREEQIAQMCDKLTTKIVQSGAEDMRDIYSIGLKKLIKVVPEKEGMGEIVTKHTVGRLLRGTKSKNETMRAECFDLLGELLRKFGEKVSDSHDDIVSVVMNEMENSSDKRAIECLGALSISMSSEKLRNMLQSLMQKMEQEIKMSRSVLAYVHAIVVLTDQIGNRLGQYVDSLVPLVFSALKTVEQNFESNVDEDGFDDAEDAMMMMSETDCELRELCMNAFSLFITKCPLDVKSHVARIVETSLKFVSYDPNYDYGNENVEEGEDEMDFGEDDEFGDMNGFGDDDDDVDNDFEYSDEEYNNGKEIEDADDVSWRVRKSAIGVLNSLVSSSSKNSVMSPDLFQQCFLAVAERFKEREEAVRIEIISCYALYVRVSVQLDKQAGLFENDMEIPSLEKQNSLTEFVCSKFEKTIEISIKFLKQFDQSIKTRSAIFQMLDDAFSVLNERGQSIPETSLRDLIPNIVSALCSNAVQLRFQAMKFFLVLLQQCPKVMSSFLKDLLPALVTCTGDDWHRLVSISLHTIAHVVRVLRPEINNNVSEDAMDDTSDKDAVDVKPFVLPLYNAVLPRLRKRDIDLQIKIRAIEASSLIVSHLGDNLDKERKRVLKLMTIRLKNETTRVAAIHGIETLARSRFRLGTVPELSNLFLESCVTLSTYLKQQNRNVTLASLGTLIAIVRDSGTNVVESEHLDTICNAVAKLLSHRDLHISHMALQFARVVLEKENKKSLNSVRNAYWENMCNLLTSSVLQGQALESLLMILQKLVSAENGIADSWLSSVFKELKSSVDGVSSLVIENLGRACSVIVLNVPKSKRDNLILGFVNDLKKCASDSSRGGYVATQKRLLLRTLGNIGSLLDLSSHDSLLESVLSCFDGDENVELVRTSAAMSLGDMAIGAKDRVFLPFILSSLSDQKKSDVDLYLISVALHNVLSSSTFDVAPHLVSLLSNLLSRCENQDEGTRNLIAKCLGTLARIDPVKVFPALQDASKANSELKRSVSVMAVKFAVASETWQDDTLSKYLADFLNLLRDESIKVVHSTLITLNTIAHHHNSMLRNTSFKDLWVTLFDHTKVRDDLKRTVNLGPFKEKIDDGLPIRKAAYTCILTMLTTMPSQVDVNRFASYLASGLAERESDVKMLCYQIMTKICSMMNARDVLMPVLDNLMVPLSRTINKRLDKVLKAKANEASIQRVRQLLFSAVRAVEALSEIESVHSNSKFLALWSTLKKNNVASTNIAGSSRGDDDGDDDNDDKMDIL